MKSYDAILKSQSAFINNLYKTLIRKEDSNNLFFSSISIHILLITLYLASDKSLKVTLSKNLKLSDNNDDEQDLNITRILNEYKLMLSNFEKLNSNQFQLLNQIYLQNKFELKKPFEMKIRDNLQTKIDRINFTDNQSIDKINKRIEDETNRRVSKMFCLDDFDNYTRLVLLNIIYFNQNWMYQFDRSKSTNSEFVLRNGDKMITTMMSLKRHFYYASYDKYDVLKVPYDGNHFQMVILLPHEGVSLHELEQTFLVEDVTERSDDFSLVKVHLFLPKFKVDTNLDLKNILSDVSFEIIFLVFITPILKFDTNIIICNVFFR